MKLRLLHQNQLCNGPILTLFESLVVFLLIAIALGMTERNDQEAIDHLLTHLLLADLSPCTHVLHSCFFLREKEARTAFLLLFECL
jgi:hypothetical protein